MISPSEIHPAQQYVSRLPRFGNAQTIVMPTRMSVFRKVANGCERNALNWEVRILSGGEPLSTSPDEDLTRAELHTETANGTRRQKFPR